MVTPWILIFFSFLYIGLLFLIAHYGDKQNIQNSLAPYKPIIYSLSLAVYCTSWTYYGAVGNASTRGWEFLAIYLGPILVFIFGHRFLRRIAKICVENNITTISDFIASRYGKAQRLSILVTLIAIMGTLPYIALQLKAVSSSYEVIAATTTSGIAFEYSAPFLKDTGLVVAIIMAIFSILFGTRFVNVSEHHEGLILAIAFESLFKLLALIFVCMFAIYGVFDGPQDIINKISHSEKITKLILTPSLNQDFLQINFIGYTILSAAAIFCLPRQFHVSFVEIDKTENMRLSRWLFPTYLIITSIVVIPITITGLLLFEDNSVNPDMFVLTIPILVNNDLMALIVFLGGLSAATGMVIIAVITLSTMICNDIVMPLLFKIKTFKLKQRSDISSVLLLVRRIAIVSILSFSYLYYRHISAYTALASIGLIAFVAAIQFAPAIIGGVYWKKGSRQGATAGLIAGFLVWLYTLFLPVLAETGLFSNNFVVNGPWGIEHFKPHALFGVNINSPISHALIFSLSANIFFYCYYSFSKNTNLIERIQAAKFTQTAGQNKSLDGLPWWSTVAVGDLRLLAEKIIGEKQTQQAFLKFSKKHSGDFTASEKADTELINFTEKLLAGAIGASSARIIISSVLNKQDLPIEDVFSIVDEASEAVHFNQELLNNTIEHIDQGICVVDENLEIIAWNSRYLEIYNFPKNLIRVGRPIANVLKHNERSNEISTKSESLSLSERIGNMRNGKPQSYLRYRIDGTVIHIQGKAMPNVGYVTSFTDVTELKRTEGELRKINENLEKIVAGRTKELSKVNHELEQAIESKNKFLTAVNHDVMQPLNAARLFSSALAQKTNDSTGLSEKINNSIRSAEEIIHTLLDISKLDSGAITTQITTFRINEILQILTEEFSVIAQQHNIDLKCIPSNLSTTSDAHLIRRILQNFIGNALKHTAPGGRVTIGCRRKNQNKNNAEFTVEIHDTGVGINQSDIEKIFEEFKQLDNQVDATQKGIGLGLAISKRISDLLDLEIIVDSKINKGSVFALKLPLTKTSNSTHLPTNTQNNLNSFDGSIDQINVLCIDNDQNVLDAMKTLLDTWQCKNLCAGSHDDAIRKINKQHFKPDLLLVDYHLDEENGVDAINKLTDQLGKHVPAILISADSSQGVKNHIKRTGLKFLSKPVNPAALRKLIAKTSHNNTCQ